MRKRSRRKLITTKKVLHEDYIDKYANLGISKSRIYKEISRSLGYDFHCSQLKNIDNLDYIIRVVQNVIESLHYEYMDK